MGIMAELLGPYLPSLQGEPTPLMDALGTGGGGLMQLAAQQQGGYDGNASRWEQVAQRMAQNQYGWGPGQFRALDQIASAESGWNPGAVNPSSGAAGIPQALPSAHPGLVTDAWMHDPRAQIRWMLDYISQRYNTPQHALEIRQQQGYY